MEKYQKRVIKEQKKLEKKVTKLINFLHSADSNTDVYILGLQLRYMKSYLSILNRRIFQWK